MLRKVLETGRPNVTRRRKIEAKAQGPAVIAVRLLNPGSTGIFKDHEWFHDVAIEYWSSEGSSNPVYHVIINMSQSAIRQYFRFIED